MIVARWRPADLPVRGQGISLPWHRRGEEGEDEGERCGLAYVMPGSKAGRCWPGYTGCMTPRDSSLVDVSGKFDVAAMYLTDSAFNPNIPSMRDIE